MRYAIGCKLDRLIYIAIGFGVRMNASRWDCPINQTLEARSTSRVVVPHIDPEQRLCSFGSVVAVEAAMVV